MHFFSKSDAKLRKNSLSCNSYGDNWMLFGTIRIGKITQKLSKLSSIDALHNKGHFSQNHPKNKAILQSINSRIAHFCEKYAFFIVFSWSNKFFAVLLQRLSNSNQLGASVPTFKERS